MKYLLYGANGYTAQLIIKESLKAGLKPILAGRTEHKVKETAAKFDLDYLVFGLDDVSYITEQLEAFDVCLNAAGPFSKTAKNMIEACIASKTHYLDITGEISVFELAKSYNKKAQEAKIMVMSGIGFDVVPSDCLANYLSAKMPDASQLELAFTSVGGALSHGTASTLVENLGEGSAARVDGKIKKVPVGHLSKKIDFGAVKHYAMTIPWGDISTAYSSTKIPNIVVYTGVPKSSVNMMKFQSLFNPILKTKLAKNLAQKWIDKNLYGPNEKQNQKGKSYFWGEISNAKNEKITALLKCKEGYLLTALCSVNICQKVLAENFKTGYQTPSSAYGYNLILEIEDSVFTDVTEA
jgi:short subunit dehydrogenase-like uncharacterized protein